MVSTNSFEWHSNGLLRKHTNSRGFTLTNTFDGLGRLLSVQYTGGTSNVFGYKDPGGNKWLDKTYMKDRDGNEHFWSYNGDRQMTNYTNPRTNSWNYGYCDFGSMDSVTDAKNKTTNYDYDFRGRRTLITYPGAGGSGGTIEYDYDLLGRLIKETVPRQRPKSC